MLGRDDQRKVSVPKAGPARRCSRGQAGRAITARFQSRRCSLGATPGAEAARTGEARVGASRALERRPEERGVLDRAQARPERERLGAELGPARAAAGGRVEAAADAEDGAAGPGEEERALDGAADGQEAGELLRGGGEEGVPEKGCLVGLEARRRLENGVDADGRRRDRRQPRLGRSGRRAASSHGAHGVWPERLLLLLLGSSG